MEALCDLWQVVMADGSEDAVEIDIVETVRTALGLSEADGAKAHQDAERALQ